MAERDRWLQIYPPQPVGPDTPEGYGCDNMSVLIVRLKPPALRRQGANFPPPSLA